MFVRKLVLASSVGGYVICSLLAACTYEAPIATMGGPGGGAGMGGSGGGGGNGSWWDTSWKKRVRITFQNAPGEKLVDFPVMVHLTPERVGDTTASATGADLRFLSDDGISILRHEVEQWTPGGEAYVWVRVPRIDPTNTDHIWLYYDNLAANDEAKPLAVWNNFLGVYHLTPSLPSPPANFPDSTQTLEGTWYDYDASDMMNPIVPGKIGNAANLDAKRYIHLGDNTAVAAQKNEARTAEAWIRASKIQNQAIVYQEGECVGWFLGTTSNNEYIGNFITDSDGVLCGSGINNYRVAVSPAAIDSWHYLALVVDRPAQKMSLYIDGAFGNSVWIDNQHLADGNGEFRIGSDHDAGDWTFDGAIDEVRVSNVARSAGWISAQYKSMTDNFLVFTTE